MQSILIKRVYEPKAEADGYRILVDRLWPRGVTRADAAVDEWMKEIAPSTELRKWFHSDAGNWEQFKHKYILELQNNPAVPTLQTLLKQYTVTTFLYAVKDEQHNHAIILRDYLQNI